MDDWMTTTAFAIEGTRIVKNHGVVRGITVRSRSVFGTIGASFQLGANAVIGFDMTPQNR